MPRVPNILKDNSFWRKWVGITSAGNIIHTFKLLLPALIPSWRFFDVIAPSPRIEFTLLETEDETPVNWTEFRPRPQRLSVIQMFKRMFWNPHWNESLFLVSCAERLMAHPTEHSRAEIQNRIVRDLKRNEDTDLMQPYLQFRLVFLDRQGTEIKKRVMYMSPIHQHIENTV